MLYKGTGKGSDAVVHLNPEFKLKNPSDPDNPMPNDAVLFHELGHANHDVHGEMDCTPNEQYDTNEEENTINHGDMTEEDYLAERGYAWKRTSHSKDFVPMYE